MSISNDSEADVSMPLSNMVGSENSRRSFMSSDISLLETGHFSDVVLICGNQAWNVHRSIICKRCTWFEKALTGDFMEAETKKITLTDIAPELVEVVVRYLYSGAIDAAALQKCEGDCIITKYVRLWSVADFFGLDLLRKEIISNMESHFEGNIKSMCDAKWLINSDDGHAIVHEFFRGAAVVYHELPHTMPCRQLLIDYAHAIRLNLYRSDEFIQGIADFPGLASDLFMVAVKGRQSKWAGDSKADYRNYFMKVKCLDCKCSSKDATSWNIDPQAQGKTIRIMEVHWKCETCVEKSGYPWQGRGDAEAEK